MKEIPPSESKGAGQVQVQELPREMVSRHPIKSVVLVIIPIPLQIEAHFIRVQLPDEVEHESTGIIKEEAGDDPLGQSGVSS